jgi:hypothetical protein
LFNVPFFIVHRHAYAHEALAIYRSILFFPMLHKALAVAIFICAHISYNPPRVLSSSCFSHRISLGSNPGICAFPSAGLQGVGMLKHDHLPE